MALKIGEILEGKVERLTKFGAFVTLPENEMGLVHISEVDTKYVKNVEDVLTVGETVRVKVIAVKEKGKIDLSIKEAKLEADKSSKENNLSFEDKMNMFLKDSEERQNSLKKHMNGGKKSGKRF